MSGKNPPGKKSPREGSGVEVGLGLGSEGGFFRGVFFPRTGRIYPIPKYIKKEIERIYNFLCNEKKCNVLGT